MSLFKIVDNFKWYMIVEIDASLNFLAVQKQNQYG